MREEEKIMAGVLFCPGEPELKVMKLKSHNLSQEYSNTREDEPEKRQRLAEEILGSYGEGSFMQGPVFFHYGKHTKIGKRCFINYNLTVQDDATVQIGDDCNFGPNVTIVTPVHPMLAGERREMLDKGIVTAQIHRHWRAAFRTVREQFGWYAHIFLFQYHPANRAFIVIGLAMAWSGALPKPIISLRIEQAFFLKPRELELVIYICSYDKILLAINQSQKIKINLAGRYIISVAKNVAAPIGPIFFPRGIGIKTGAIHILKVVFCNKIKKLRFKTLPTVSKASRRRQARACTNHNRISLFKFLR